MDLTKNPRFVGSHVVTWLIFVGCLLRIATVFAFNPLDWRVSDGLRHWHNAENLFSSHVMPTLDPLGYQVFIWVFRQLLGESYFGWG